MSGHLCLKWNNHSSAFLKSIGTIQAKERFCDATIACQGKYFPVHRVVLSTCSDYFDEMFERMQCQHPYIVFKDIEPREMELLLNYMYQGEVNVIQESLPALIKAAEALKVKGLAVPDDLPSNSKESSGKKRSSASNDNPTPKRRAEEKRKRRLSSQNNQTEAESVLSNRNPLSSENFEARTIKAEPLDASDYTDGNVGADSSLPNASPAVGKEESVFVDFPIAGDTTTYIKSEDNLSQGDDYEGQSSSWDDFSNSNMIESLPNQSMESQDDVSRTGSSSNILDEDIEDINDQLSYNYNEPGTEYYCSLCSFTTTTLTLIKDHRKRDHPTANRPHVCQICSCQFKTSSALTIHVRSHTGEKPYWCPLCPYRSAQSTHVSRHMKIHRKKNRE